MFSHIRTQAAGFAIGAALAAVVFGTSLAAAAAPAPRHTPAANAAAQAVQPQSALENELERERELTRSKTESLDKRLDDANSRISDMGIGLSILALLMTVIIGGGTVVGYFGAQQRTRELVNQWMEQNATKLESDIKRIEARAAGAQRLADEADARAKEMEALYTLTRQRYEQFHATAERFSREYEEARVRVQATLNSSISPTQSPAERAPAAADVSLSEAQRGVLKTAEQLLREKPESEYSAADWENRALASFGLGNFESAVTYFRQAALADGAQPSDIARSGVNRGIALGRLARYDEAIAAYDDVIAHYRDDNDVSIRVQAAKAFTNKTVSQYMLGRFDDVVATSNDAAARYKDDKQPAIRNELAQATFNKCEALVRLGRYEDAVNGYDELVSRYRDDEAPELRELVISALVGKGLALTQLGRFDDAVAAIDGVTKRFEGDAVPLSAAFQSGVFANAAGVLLFAGDAARALAAADKALALADAGSPVFILRALANKADALTRLKRCDEALTVLDDAISRFADSADATMRERLVEVHFMKAVVLGWLGRAREALAAFDELIARNSESQNKWVQLMVQKATEYHTRPASEWNFIDIVWQGE